MVQIVSTPIKSKADFTYINLHPKGILEAIISLGHNLICGHLSV
jgi:hypothetical protein